MTMERVPFAPGLFSEKDGGALLAARCKSCQRVFFPQRSACLECSSTELQSVELRNTAKLYTYTGVQMPVHKFKPPFVLCWVEFPEGVRVMGQVKNKDSKKLKIGMDMKLVFDVLWKEEDKDIIGYKFEPVS